MENSKVIFQKESKENENKAINIQNITNVKTLGGSVDKEKRKGIINDLKFHKTFSCAAKQCLAKSTERREIGKNNEKQKIQLVRLNLEKKGKEDGFQDEDVRLLEEEMMSTMSKNVEDDVLDTAVASSSFLCSFASNDSKLSTNKVEGRLFKNLFISNNTHKIDEEKGRKKVINKLEDTGKEGSVNDKNMSTKYNQGIFSSYNSDSNNITNHLSLSNSIIKDKIDENKFVYFSNKNNDSIATYEQIKEINAMRNINSADGGVYSFFPSSNAVSCSKLKTNNNASNLSTNTHNNNLLDRYCRSEINYKDIKYNVENKNINILVNNENINVPCSLISNKQNLNYFNKGKIEDRKALSTSVINEATENKIETKKGQCKIKVDFDKQKYANNIKEKKIKKKEELLEVRNVELEEDDDSVVSQIVNKILKEEKDELLKEKSVNFINNVDISTENVEKNTLKTEELRKILMKIVDELLINENVVEVNVAQILQKVQKKKQIDFSDLIFPSLGALLHHQGFCKPCVFANKNKKTCHNAACCYFCHFYHKEKRRRNKKNKVKDNSSHNFFPPPPPSNSPVVNSFFLNSNTAIRNCPPPPPFEDSCFSSLNYSMLFNSVSGNNNCVENAITKRADLHSISNNSKNHASCYNALNVNFVNKNNNNNCIFNPLTHLKSNTANTSNDISHSFTSFYLDSSSQVSLFSSGEKEKEHESLENNLIFLINALNKEEKKALNVQDDLQLAKEEHYLHLGANDKTEADNNKYVLREKKLNSDKESNLIQNGNTKSGNVKNDEHDKSTNDKNTGKDNFTNSVFALLKGLPQNELFTLLKFVETVVQQKQSDAENTYDTDISQVSLKNENNLHLENLYDSSYFPCRSEVLSSAESNLASCFSSLISSSNAFLSSICLSSYSSSIMNNSIQNNNGIILGDEYVNSNIYYNDNSKYVSKSEHEEAKKDYGLKNPVVRCIDLMEKKNKIDSNLSFYSNFSQCYSLPSFFCSLHNIDDTLFSSKGENINKISLVEQNELCQEKNEGTVSSSLISSFLQKCNNNINVDEKKHVVEESNNKDDAFEKLYTDENASLFVNLFSSYSTSSTLVSVACDVSTNNDAYSNNSDNNDLCNLENKTNDSSLTYFYDEKSVNISSLSDCSSVFGKGYAFPYCNEEEKKICVLNSDISFSFNELEDKSKSSDTNTDALVSEGEKEELEKKITCIMNSYSYNDSNNNNICSCEDKQHSKLCEVQHNNFSCVLPYQSNVCNTNDLIKNLNLSLLRDNNFCSNFDDYGTKQIESTGICTNFSTQDFMSNTSFLSSSSFLGVTTTEYERNDKSVEFSNNDKNILNCNSKLGHEKKDVCLPNNCSCVVHDSQNNHSDVYNSCKDSCDSKTDLCSSLFNNYFNCYYSNEMNNHSLDHMYGNNNIGSMHYYNDYMCEKNNRMYIINTEDILDTASEIYALKMLNDIATTTAYSTLVDAPSNITSISSSSLIKINSNDVNSSGLNSCLNINNENDLVYYNNHVEAIKKHNLNDDITSTYSEILNRNFKCNNTENNSIKALINFKKLGHLW